MKKLAVIVLLLGIITVVVSFYSHKKNIALKELLHNCESYGIVKANVFFSNPFKANRIIFDLNDDSSEHERRIDPVHLLLQFSAKLDLEKIDRLILSHNGSNKIYIMGSDLKSLANSYRNGGRIWSFTHLPENIYLMSGEQPFSEKSGKLLQVIGKQAEDVNSLIEIWTGH